jgi:shikimate 5-dehydrogenase
MINENTKIMARFHSEANNRGMSIYNPYFKETNTNAAYILFHNPDPTPLIEGLRNLNLAGAVPAGFEKDPKLVELVDELGPVAKRINRVAVLRYRDGKLTGFHQGGYALSEAISRKTDIDGKKMVIMGAGNVVRALLVYFELNNITPDVEVYNRTLEKAEKIAEEFKCVNKIGNLQEMEQSTGDIFVNATYVGSPWLKGDSYEFKEKMIAGFEFISDVTFVPLKPALIELAEKLGKKNSPGWEMFLYQGKMCLEKALDIEVDEKILAKYVVNDFEHNWA